MWVVRQYAYDGCLKMGPPHIVSRVIRDLAPRDCIGQ